MVFNTGAALLDAIVLAVVSKDEEGTYGYDRNIGIHAVSGAAPAAERRLPASV